MAASVASRSISHSASHSVCSQTPAGAIHTKTETLIDKLDFDRSLIPDDPSAGIRCYYQCYKAVLAATLKYEKMHKSKDWDASFIPTTNDIINIVTSRTMWYSHYKLFEKVSRYTQMMHLPISNYRGLNLVFISGPIFKLLSNVVENHWRIQMMNQMGQKHRQRRRRLTRRPRPRPRGSQGPKQHHRVERSQKVKRNQNLFRNCLRRKLPVVVAGGRVFLNIS